MTQVYNFSAGPAMMPKAVLEQAQIRTSTKRAFKLARSRHFSDGSEPPWQTFYGTDCRSR